MEFLRSSSAFAHRETGMTSWTRALLIPKADTYFLETGLFFLHHFLSACFLEQVERASITLQPELWDYLQCARPKSRLAVTEVLRSANLSFGLRSLFLEEIFCICLTGWNNTTQDRSCFGCRSFSQTRNCFCQPEVNPCHSASCRSLGVVFLQKPKPKFLNKQLKWIMQKKKRRSGGSTGLLLLF